MPRNQWKSPEYWKWSRKTGSVSRSLKVPLVYHPPEKEKPDLLQAHCANCQKRAGKVVGKSVPNLICWLIDALYKIHELIVEESKILTWKFVECLVFWTSRFNSLQKLIWSQWSFFWRDSTRRVELQIRHYQTELVPVTQKRYRKRQRMSTTQAAKQFPGFTHQAKNIAFASSGTSSCPCY